MKLVGFGASLALVFGGAALAGGAIDPDRKASEPAAAAHGGGEEEMAPHPVRGLAIAENGLRILVDDPDFRRGRTEQLRFRIVDEEGATVRDFDVEHEKRMHLIVARRDLTGFQHLHPAQQADGSWTTPLQLDDPGSYRIFADFARDEEKTTLATDLRVDGPADLQPLPAPSETSVSDGGYDVALSRDGDELAFDIRRDGRPITTEPYLGAGGHLVALREGDLGFLHVHPNDDDTRVAFEAEFPTAGRYRLFLQFKHEGRIHTVAFTEVV
jgi:hypothetical protein